MGEENEHVLIDGCGPVSQWRPCVPVHIKPRETYSGVASVILMFLTWKARPRKEEEAFPKVGTAK